MTPGVLMKRKGMKRRFLRKRRGWILPRRSGRSSVVRPGVSAAPIAIAIEAYYKESFQVELIVTLTIAHKKLRGAFLATKSIRRTIKDEKRFLERLFGLGLSGRKRV
jgi:hypothetical protein